MKINKNNLVSSDYIGSLIPTIIDYSATQQLHEKGIKFSLWYDNEYSYCANMIRLIKSMYNKNNLSNKNHISQINCNNKNVFIRVDYNVPINNNEITDTYRIEKTKKTIEKILSDEPDNLIIATHFGRPIAGSFDEKYSTRQLLPILEKTFNTVFGFLPNGLNTTENQLYKEKITRKTKIFLMENTRFHDFETNPKTSNFNIEIPIDIYVNEAFSCTHRKHTSMSYINADKNVTDINYIKKWNH